MNGAEHETPPTSGETLVSPLSRGDRGAIPVLESNRPGKPNALGDGPIAAPMGAPDEIELDPAVRAIAITGAGRAFGIGYDVVARRHRQADPAEAVARFPRPSQHVTRRVGSFPKPVIAAVDDPARGCGREAVEATRIAPAAQEATRPKAEVDIGVIPTAGDTPCLPRDIERRVAHEPIPTGRPFDAARLGPVNRVVAGAGVPARAVALTRDLTTKPPLAPAAHRGMDTAIGGGPAIEEAAPRVPCPAVTPGTVSWPA